MHANRSAVVVGAGPNGLAAAVSLARAGVGVTVYEAASSVGGGTRTQELTIPGFRHDVCSAVHPLAASSPFFNSVPLDKHGLTWVQPDIPLAHPFDDGSAVTLGHSLIETCAGLGEDGTAYDTLIAPLVWDWRRLVPQVLGPPLRRPQNPFLMARFGMRAIQPATRLIRCFKDERARALFAGLAAHAAVPLDSMFSSAGGLMLAAAAHVTGWPVARGGSQSIAGALASYLKSLSGEVITDHRVGSLTELPQVDAKLLDITPRQLLEIGEERLPAAYARRLGRFKYGFGAFKLDLALDAPIPWTAEACRRAGTIHLGPTSADIIEAEAAVARKELPGTPYVLVAQQRLFDTTRAPEGKQVAWAYCHVPLGSEADMTEPILAQIERFAPGIRDRVLASHAMTAAQLESYNENYVGGDIAAGSVAGLQLLMRPTWNALKPYEAGSPGLYLCSASTPPGPGVHGMCGYFAAEAALRRLR